MAKKFSLDQNAIKQFFFLHVEKLVVGVAGVLLLMFLWMGWKTAPYSTRTPAELRDLAKRADSYVETKESWEKISSYRQGDDRSDVRIKAAAANVMDPEKYQTIRLALKEKQAGLRNDPALYNPDDYELSVRAFNAPVFINQQNPRLATLEPATDSSDTGSSGGDRPQGGAGGGLDEGQGNTDTGPKRKKIEPFGSSFLDIHKMEIVGLRPESGVRGMAPAVVPIVEVIGVVPFENQWARYDQVFKDARAYTPTRDRPKHVFLEVQRKMVDEGDDKWVTINKTDAPSGLEAFNGISSPEIIDPNFYDPALTMSLPPFAYFDYRRLTTYPKVPYRKLQPSTLFAEEKGELVTFDPNSAFRGNGTGSGDTKDGPGSRGSGSSSNTDVSEVESMMGKSMYLYEQAANVKKPQAPFKMIRFFDYKPPQEGEFHYRVRAWFEDPNNPPEEAISADGGRGGRNAPQVGNAGLDEGGGGNNRGGAAGDAYVYVPVDKESLGADVRTRLYEQSKPEFTKSLPDKRLVNARPADWSNPTEAVSIEPLKNKRVADVVVGEVAETRTWKIQGVEIPREEVTAKVVVNSVVDGLFSFVPFSREVFRGDYLNFTKDRVHLLHPLDWTVRKLTDAKVESNKLVVDIMGGRGIDLRAVEATDIQPNPVEGFEPPPGNTVPGEILVMNADGTFQVRNSVDEYGKYRALLFLPDETNEYGKKKVVERSSDEGRGDGGGGNNR